MDGLILLRRARNAGLRVEAAGGMLLIRGPKQAESVVKLLTEHKTEVLAVLSSATYEAEPLAPAPWFERLIPPFDGEPGVEQPCPSRRGRVQELEGAIVLHFCCDCGRWGVYGYDVNLRARRLGRWYCAEHRPQQPPG